MPANGASLVREVIRAADRAGLVAYLVGGPVRDLLLGRPFHNADISIEGDAIALAEEVASRSKHRIVRHPRFGTATIRSGDFVLDLVTTRSETYEYPGALPTVSPGSIDEDIRRRDFTVNAMALQLNGDRAGRTLDPLNGHDDLNGGLIRVLHESSFQDDATRIMRAVRYEQRLGFQLGPRTEQWLLRDVNYVETISPARIHHEFARTFDEDEPERTLLRLSELGVLSTIHGALSFGRRLARAFGSVRSLDRRAARAAYWPIMCWYAADAPGVAERLALHRPQADAVAGVVEIRRVETRLAAPKMANSRIVEVLGPFPVATVWAFAAMTDFDLAHERAVSYLRRLRRVKTALTGDDIIALGAKQGPTVGDVLRRLKIARLDGDITTRTDEERLARDLLKHPS